ncbi:hypothetical protein [Mesorhizobium sp. M1076]|uniref:hypothetical protein n=1 Tax=Mesorhizobium sp. M1076 TaxID=2957054 RepID=UPI0033357D90
MATPNNPTGAVYSADELTNIGGICKRHGITGILVMPSSLKETWGENCRARTHRKRVQNARLIMPACGSRECPRLPERRPVRQA